MEPKVPTNTIRLTRPYPNSAWSQCGNRQSQNHSLVCGNPVEFGADGSEGVCQCCGAAWKADGLIAIHVGTWICGAHFVPTPKSPPAG